MIHIKMHAKRTIDADKDPMGRTWVGYDPSLSDGDNFKQNRGRWVLGSRADREQYAAFSYTEDHTIKFVAEIHGLEPSGKKRTITGRVLPADHRIAQRLVGEESLDHYRNPTTYVDDDPSCACGCGGETKAGRAFIPGHDQRAIHERISRQWGGTVAFIRWFDENYPDSA